MKLQTKVTCVECDRVFDLLNETDAEEWGYGHDCEAQLVKIRPVAVWAAGRFAARARRMFVLARPPHSILGNTYRREMTGHRFY